MTDLIIRDRRPTADEAKMAVRWLLWLSDWPEHDGPEMYRVSEDKDEEGELIWLVGVADNHILRTGPFDNAVGEVWRGLDRTGAAVQYEVPNG